MWLPQFAVVLDSGVLPHSGKHVEDGLAHVVVVPGLGAAAIDWGTGGRVAAMIPFQPA